MERFDCQFYIGFSKNPYSYHNGKVWLSVLHWIFKESVFISQWKGLIVSFTLDFQRISIHITMERFDCQFYIGFSKNQYSYHNGKVRLSVLHWVFKESVFISQWKGLIVSFTLDFQRISIDITMERFDCQFYIGFLPEASFGLRVLSLPASVCVSVCLSVGVCGNHLLVRAITHHPFQLGSPNLDHRCKRPWLRSLSFWGWLTLTFKVKFNFKVKSYPILSLSAR